MSDIKRLQRQLGAMLLPPVYHREKNPSFRRWISVEEILMERVLAMLPKSVPAEAIASVECDPYDGEDGGPSYWVYLHDGWWCPSMECHTIHEDTLKELKNKIKEIEKEN